MIDDIGLTPSGAIRARAAGTLSHAGVEQKEVQPVPPELLQGLLRKGLDCLEV